MKYKQTPSQWAIDQVCTLFALKEFGSLDNAEFFKRLKDIEQKALAKEEQELESLKDFEVWKQWKNNN